MRKALYAVSIAALTAALATPALAAPYQDDPAAPVAGAVAGTAIGLGITEGWWGATVAGTALPTTAAGAAAIGGVAGLGAVAFTDAVLQPCAGFHAMFLLNQDYCAQQNGYGARVASYQGKRVRHIR